MARNHIFRFYKDGMFHYITLENDNASLHLIEMARTYKIELDEFTGLLDTNGARIFENDLVAHLKTGTQEELSRGIVEYRNGYFALSGDDHGDYMNEMAAHDYVIVGNVYQDKT